MNFKPKFRLAIARRNVGHRLLVLAAVTGTLALAGIPASAVPITGEIHFWGSFTPTGGTGLGNATGLHFNNPSYVIAASGDFSASGLSPWVSQATLHDFQFKPFDLSQANPLWTAGSFSFTLESIHIDLQSSTQLNLSGQGFLMGPAGYDPTPGTWNFQGGGTGSFTFRADDVAAVPDASNTLVLLGTFLTGIVICQKYSVTRNLKSRGE